MVEPVGVAEGEPVGEGVASVADAASAGTTASMPPPRNCQRWLAWS
ncbi:MAG: hypothetical protein JO023_10855 [Chloroflexi bacterium]|nr:hypothetical protein [Chloroflexota bacterium]